MMLLNDKNPNLNHLLDEIKKNDGYCLYKEEKCQDNKCPCRQFREGESGVCKCGIFIKI